METVSNTFQRPWALFTIRIQNLATTKQKMCILGRHSTYPIYFADTPASNKDIMYFNFKSKEILAVHF